MWIIENWKLLGSIAGGILLTANSIAALTPNETDNKWIARIQKVVDLVAMSTGKTKLKGDLDV